MAAPIFPESSPPATALADSVSSTYMSPTQTSVATATQPPSKGGNNTLYLFTFLTTLLLLLAVSCGIIFRSFILRRRFRRQVEAALTSGTMIPGSEVHIWLNGGRPGRRPPVNLKDKPKMWEVALSGPTLLDDTDEWEGIIQPVSATMQRPSAAGGPGLEASKAVPSRRPRGHRGLRISFGHLPWKPSDPTAAAITDSQPTSPHSTVDPPSTEATSKPAQRPVEPALSVSVLVAMPNAKRPVYGASEQPHLAPPSDETPPNAETDTQMPSNGLNRTYPSEELPDIAIGVSEPKWVNDDAEKLTPPGTE